jgi:D-alanine-D-alanine ligase-like ATP-grasp enzyme
MIHVSNSLPNIAVLRGGSASFKASMEEGREVLQSLTKIGYVPLDIVIDQENSWTANGVPTDAHLIYSTCHTVVDTTRMKNQAYQALAKRMGATLIFSHDDVFCLNREDMYRVLRQKGFKVPETVTLRASAPIKEGFWRHIWSTYHTPLMVRPLDTDTGHSAKLVRVFKDLEEVVRAFHEQGIDVHILTYKKSPTTSIALLPYFRGEKLYTPVWVETFATIDAIPNRESPMRAHMQAPEYRKEQIRKFATSVYEALDLTGPACIDLVPHGDEYIVVNVNTHPSLRATGRFMQSLSTTGVDVGQYVHEKIKEEFGV